MSRRGAPTPGPSVSLRLGRVAERTLNGAVPTILSLAAELLQILIVRRQDDIGPSARILGAAGADEARLVGLHGAVEIVELRILVEGAGVGVRGLGVGLGADDLRLLEALRLDRARFLLARRAHPLIGGIKRRAVGQIGALDAHVDD